MSGVIPRRPSVALRALASTNGGYACALLAWMCSPKWISPSMFMFLVVWSWSYVVVCGRMWSYAVVCGRIWSHAVVCGRMWSWSAQLVNTHNSFSLSLDLSFFFTLYISTYTMGSLIWDFEILSCFCCFKLWDSPGCYIGEILWWICISMSQSLGIA
jgi:hypothetical protein